VTAESFRDRLASRLEQACISLTDKQIELLAEYWRLLERWNSRMNLTALPLHGFPFATIDKLLVEPLVGSALMPAGSVVWYDAGSGGGSPAIPLKVLHPGAHLTLVESRSRKAAFLREVVRSLGLDGLQVKNARFEEVAASHPMTADLVTVRAVRVDETFLDVVMRVLKQDGRLLLFESADGVGQLQTFNLINTVSIPSTDSVARLFVPRGTKG
jgi:16S rRNA (guanine527-N7)-methyltransferase